jgi:general secretion pathway protein A
MSEIYYGAFYGFHTAPFHVTPDASLLFPTATYQEALGAIEYGITAGKGFIVVSGQVGVGKTTVLRVCLDRLDPAKTKIIYLFNPALTTAQLYTTLLDELDPNLRVSMSPRDTLRTLLRGLLEAHQAGTQVVLAVDEAQNMPERTLESLRILSNLETTKTKLLQIILVGQPELDELLKKHRLRQLAQRVAVRAHIKRLTFRQSCRYIQHRTRCAGRSRPLFTAPAQWYIAFAARGIPRIINICCDNALINGYGHSAQCISLGVAREACNSLEYRPLRRAAALTGALIVLLCGVLSGPALRDRFFGVPAPSAPVSLEEPAPRVQVAASPAVTAPAADTAADQSANAQGTAKPRLRWVVRKGDSVYKACFETYGSCYDTTLRAVLADNPQFGSGAVIHEGDILTMPGSIGPLRAKPH